MIFVNDVVRLTKNDRVFTGEFEDGKYTGRALLDCWNPVRSYSGMISNSSKGYEHEYFSFEEGFVPKEGVPYICGMRIGKKWVDGQRGRRSLKILHRLTNPIELIPNVQKGPHDSFMLIEEGFCRESGIFGRGCISADEKTIYVFEGGFRAKMSDDFKTENNLW